MNCLGMNQARLQGQPLCAAAVAAAPLRHMVPAVLVMHQACLSTCRCCCQQEELVSTSQQVQNVEKTMREITTLNQMISTAVMHQAETIEQLYNTAVEATSNMQRGNEDLRKTIRLNRSTRWYIFVLLMTASFLLLFYDWFNS